jgi:hypothetical protein
MHRDHFAEAADDIDWLPEVSRRNWIILSKDQFNWLEREAITNAKGRAFLLIWGSLSGDEQVSIICGALRRILRILKTTPAPFIARIHRTRRVVVMPREFRR